MAQTESEKLDVGDRFPHMILNLTDGRTVALPVREVNHFIVLLVYRGKW